MSANPETIVVSRSRRSGWRAWLSRWATQYAPHAKIVNGSIVLLIGSVFVSLANFGYNIGVARLLGPSDFSHAAAAVTILMLVSALTLSFQLVCAKLVAKANTREQKAAVYQHLRKRAWAIGLALGAFMLIANSPLTAYLRLSTPWIIILLAIGLAIYVPLGVKRGGLQGTCRFKGLAWNMGAEAIVKFVGAIVLIEFGFGVLGAVAAISASVILAFCLPDSARELRGPRVLSGHTPPVGEARQAIVFFVGQVIISNIDILMVKHFFRPDEAGLYAAIALVGRLLYFGAWSIVSAMFPVSAEGETEKPAASLLAFPLLMVTGMSIVFVLVLATFPTFIFQALFGSHFQIGVGDLNLLLSMNAAATGVYAIAVVLITYEMSRRIANTGWLQLAVSGLIVIGITWFHSTLLEVIIVQQVLRILLLLAVVFPFVKGWASAGGRLHEEVTAGY
ncbi:MAG: oligosaccharide flippase family protein [Candidatus Korobacteraceae bacterium]